MVGNVYPRVGLEGTLGEGMCIFGRYSSGPYASEIHLLFPVMQIDEKMPELRSLLMVKKKHLSLLHFNMQQVTPETVINRKITWMPHTLP